MTQPPAEAKPGYLDRIQARCEKATQVVRWYAHPYEGQVRGPFFRWFQCQEGSPTHQKNVSSVEDDVEFAAMAMNEVPELLKRLRLAISSLRSECRCSPREPGIPVGRCCDSCRAVSQLEADPEDSNGV